MGFQEIRIQPHLHNFTTKRIIDNIAAQTFLQNDRYTCHQGDCTHTTESNKSEDVKHIYQFLPAHSTVPPSCLVYSTNGFSHQVSHSRSNDHPVPNNTKKYILIKFSYKHLK